MLPASNYTGPNGTTVPGQQVDQATQALQGLQKVSEQVGGLVNNRPADLATARTNLEQTYQVPQATQQYQMTSDDLAKMAAADSGFASKYANFTPQGQLTGINGYTSTNVPSPDFITGGMKADTNSTMSLLDKLSGFISQGYSNVKGGMATNEAAYRDSLQGLLDIAGKYTDIHKQLLSAGLTPKDIADLNIQNRKQALAEWEAGYGEGGQNLMDSIKTGNRQDAIDAYNTAPSLQFKTKIANAWKAAHGGPLIAAPMNDKEIQDLNGTLDTYNTIQRIQNVMNKYADKFPHGVIGNLENWAVTSGLAGTVPIPGLPADMQQALGDLVKLRGQGERQMIGGRLTGYLLNRLGTAFPGAEKSIDLNTAHLDTMKKSLQNDLTLFAKQRGYNNYQDLVGDNGLQVEQPYSKVSSGWSL